MSETRTTKKRPTVKPSEQTDTPVEVGVDGTVENGKTKKPAAKPATAKTTAVKPATTKTAQPKKTTTKPSTAKSTTTNAAAKTTAAKTASAESARGAKRSTAKSEATVKQPNSGFGLLLDIAQTADVEAESVAPVESAVEQADKISVEQAAEVAPVDTENGQNGYGVAESVVTASVKSKSDNANGGSAAVAQADCGAAVKRKRKMSVVGIVFTCIGVAIVLFLFFVAVTLAVDKFVKKSPVPSFFGTSTLIVTTGSMSGTIEDGDMIVVKKSDEYKIGDIITFLPAGDSIPTTHRIIRVNDGMFYTKGDANNAEDTRAIEKSDIVGKVAFTVPHVGLFFRWLKDDLGWVYIVAIVVVVIAGIVLLKQFPVNKKINKD